MIQNIIFCVLSLLLTFTVSITDGIAKSFKPKNQKSSVLLLNSYDQEMNWVKGITRGVLDTFSQTEGSISVRIENMDTKMISSSQYHEVYANYLKVKYKDVSLSVILASDNNAYDFLRKYRDKIFPDIPVVFCGVNNFQPEQIAHLDSFTGLEEVISFKETVHLISINHPKATEIFIINDYLPTGRAWVEYIKKNLQESKLEIKIRFSDDVPLPDLKEEIKNLPETSIVLLGIYYSDTHGFSSTYEAIGEELAEVSKVPVYCLAEFNINQYVIGGIVISGNSEGSAIANTALKIIDGVSPQTIPVRSTGSNRGIFNYPRLVEYGIDEQQLPPNSIVINRPFSLYETYYAQIWLIILFIGGLLLIISSLVINITKRKRAELLLKSSEQKFRAFFEMASVGVAQLDIRSGKYERINQKYCEIVGFDMKELLGFTTDNITHPNDLEFQQQQMQLLLEGQISEFTIEKRYIQKNGTVVWAYLTASPLWSDGEKPDYVLGVIRDITARKHAEEHLVFAKKVFDNSIEGIVVTDADGVILQVNASFSTITGYTAAEVIGQNPRILKSDKHPASFYKEMWGKVATEGQWAGVTWNRRKNGEAYPEWLTISAVENDKGQITNYVSIFHDISHHVQQQEVIEHQAQHDALTELPNRVLINDRLENALEKIQRSGNQVALLYLDIDNFKYINDAFGHTVGDDILVELSKRFSSIIRNADTVARLGGDDFLVLLTELEDMTVVSDIAMRLLGSLEEPFKQSDVVFFVTASVGVTVAPDDGVDPVTLVKNAEVAMYRAKSLGKNNYQYFAPELDAQVHRRIALEMKLRKAIELEEFELYYQPLVDSVSGKIVGAEALIRWLSEGKIISPGEFIPLAEDSGLILPLGEWVLKTAARQAMKWQEAGYSLTVSVNISSRQFAGQGLFKLVKDVLYDTGLEPGRLYLEVTESMVMGDLVNAERIMGALRELGIKFYLDDFGTGYSSLAYLKRLPIDGLKIDRSFVNDIIEDVDSEAIVAVITSLANTLKLQIVAEGVETIDQWKILHGMSEMLIQGYLVSKPVPSDKFEILFQEGDILWNDLLLATNIDA
jgi:diguanylate cyclase (GGDEF)-like protein/PAS domain S-box-containing protein